jgi:D-proline reductase (dithiol) PrdB
VCHQTVSLVARHLEQAGLPTVVVGSARDIVEECGVPRFLFTDFPLGNPVGKPGDVDMQRAIVTMSIELLERAWTPRTTIQTPFVWDPADEGWRAQFMRVDDDNRAALAAAGEQRRQDQAAARAEGRARRS